MPIKRNADVELRAMTEAANLIAASARTSPKGRGVDNVAIAVVTGAEKDELAGAVERHHESKRNPLPFFKRDAEALRKSPAVILIGVKGTMPKKPESPINCGACGNETCADFIVAEKRKGEDFVGPICIFEAVDLGIALGSAVKMASNLNMDNRLMYTIGAAAKDLELLDADVIVGIPISSTGKNIYFDRH